MAVRSFFLVEEREIEQSRGGWEETLAIRGPQQQGFHFREERSAAMQETALKRGIPKNRCFSHPFLFMRDLADVGEPFSPPRPKVFLDGLWRPVRYTWRLDCSGTTPAGGDPCL